MQKEYKTKVRDRYRTAERSDGPDITPGQRLKTPHEQGRIGGGGHWDMFLPIGRRRRPAVPVGVLIGSKAPTIHEGADN